MWLRGWKISSWRLDVTRKQHCEWQIQETSWALCLRIKWQTFCLKYSWVCNCHTLPREDSGSTSSNEAPDNRRIHSSFIGGHKGITRTYRRIRKRYTWPGLRDQITEFIQGCKSCLEQKHVRARTREPMLITDTPAEPFDKVSLDTVGKLPPTPNGNRTSSRSTAWSTPTSFWSFIDEVSRVCWCAL